MPKHYKWKLIKLPSGEPYIYIWPLNIYKVAAKLELPEGEWYHSNLPMKKIKHIRDLVKDCWEEVSEERYRLKPSGGIRRISTQDWLYRIVTNEI